MSTKTTNITLTPEVYLLAKNGHQATLINLWIRELTFNNHYQPIDVDISTMELFYKLLETIKMKKGNNYQAEIIEVIEHLNDITGSKFRASGVANRNPIVSVLNQGYKVADLKMVIENQYMSWGNDPVMCEYLRPSTLFGNKFENYLNAAIQRKNNANKPNATSNKKSANYMQSITDAVSATSRSIGDAFHNSKH